MNQRVSPVRPWVDMTIKSAFSAVAVAVTIWAGTPISTWVRMDTFGHAQRWAISCRYSSASAICSSATLASKRGISAPPAAVTSTSWWRGTRSKIISRANCTAVGSAASANGEPSKGTMTRLNMRLSLVGEWFVGWKNDEVRNPSSERIRHSLFPYTTLPTRPSTSDKPPQPPRKMSLELVS